MTIAFDVAGDGPAVVLLHSGVCDRRMWDGQWDLLLDAGFRVVRGDFRGFGETPAPERPFSPAEDVRDLMDELGVGQAALVGSSYGGRVAVEMAARWPERVEAVALLCAGLPGREESPELAALDEREVALIEAGDVAAAVELMVENWLGPSADERARDAVRRMQRRAYEVQLAAAEEFGTVRYAFDPATVRARCLAVSGAHDFTDFREIAAELAGLLPDARHVELPWAGHLPSLERPAEIGELLVGFLRERAVTA